MLMVVAPTRRELGGLAAGVKGDVLVAVTGLGRAATIQSLAALLGEHRPAAIVSLGFAGGLTSDARPGEVVLCHQVTAPGETGAEAIAPAQSLLELARQIGMTCRQRGLATVPTPLLTEKAKLITGQQTGAAVVDMEGYWVAREAQKAGVPCLLVRAIVDSAGMSLPTMVQTIVADGGRRELRHTVGYLVGEPWHIGQVIRLAVNARRAAKGLNKAVKGLVVPLAGRLQGAHGL